MAVADSPETEPPAPNGSTTSTASKNATAGAQTTQTTPGRAPDPDTTAPQDNHDAIQYTYMFKQDKNPTALLASLLKATGKHIVSLTASTSLWLPLTDLARNATLDRPHWGLKRH